MKNNRITKKHIIISISSFINEITADGTNNSEWKQAFREEQAF